MSADSPPSGHCRHASPPAGRCRGFRRHKGLLLALMALLAVLLADQASKFAVLEAASSGRIPEAWSGWFNLVLVWNRGMSFGMFAQNQPIGDTITSAWQLKLLTFLLMSGLLYWLWTATHWVQSLALGLVLGGALGNLIDRFSYGAVVDFLDFHWGGWHYPAFNIADAGICVGVVLLIIESIVNPAQKSAHPAARPSAEAKGAEIAAPDAVSQEPPHV